MRILLRIVGAIVLLLLVVGIVFTSSMTFRKSDEKTKAYFAEANVSVQIHRKKWGDRELRYVETSRLGADAPLVVFVHGAPGSASEVYNYLKDSQLLAKARLVALDRPGYGYSGYGRAEPSIDKQSEAVCAVVDSYPQASKVILVGHSYGGPIIGKCARKHPDKFAAILMLAPVNDPASEQVFWFAHLSQWAITRWMMSRALQVSGDEKVVHPTELRKMEQDWRQISIPVVHVHGAKDQMLAPPGNIDFSKTHIRPEMLKLRVLPQGDHLIPFNEPAIVREEILALLQ